MARKDLLKNLMNPPEAEPGASAPKRYSKGAIGAVSQSIADLKARSIAEIDPFDIAASDISDRLDYDEDLPQLIDSIREYGQQVPVLVRPHPSEPDKFQIVYGRRRVLALRELKRPVKALIRDMDDTELVVAQGQENSARKDLTFIERARFAMQLDALGYSRRIMADALDTDQSLLSRMISVAQTFPEELLRKIGPAPGIGRPRWIEAAALMERCDWDIGEILSAVMGKTSDERFEAMYGAISFGLRVERRAARAPSEPQSLIVSGGPVGTVTRSKTKTTLTLSRKAADGFDDWLIENFAEIHRRYEDERGE